MGTIQNSTRTRTLYIDFLLRSILLYVYRVAYSPLQIQFDNINTRFLKPLKFFTIERTTMRSDEIGNAAIKHAVKSIRKRHLLEEAAHSPAFKALSRPFLHQGSEWKEKAEKLELELQQCYKAQSRLSEQLVVEVAECRNSKVLIEEKETIIANLQKEFNQTREESVQLKEILEEKTNALDLVMSENEALKVQLEEATRKAKEAEEENKMLIDRWMLQKMQDAERMNEVNAMYEEMKNQMAAKNMEELARKKVDGIVRQFEAGSESLSLASLPTACKHKFHAHNGGCGSMVFEHSSSKLITGGQDGTVQIWDSDTGMLNTSLNGCLGSVLDLSVTNDDRFSIAASSSKNLYVWEVGSGRVRHTLTGHTDKVCAVDGGKHSSKHAVSAAYDRSMKVWDLNRGYCINTIICHSNCNAICFSLDGNTICSGHVDGNIRLWDIKSGKVITEVAAHTLAITSLCLSGTGNLVLTSGRDNVHNLFDIRTLEVCDSLRASGNRVASNWSRSCLSPDDNYVAAGSADGTVYVWSRLKKNKVTTLSEHTASILCCSWSEMGQPLATADKNGTVCIWT